MGFIKSKFRIVKNITTCILETVFGIPLLLFIYVCGFIIISTISVIVFILGSIWVVFAPFVNPKNIPHFQCNNIDDKFVGITLEFNETD